MGGKDARSKLRNLTAKIDEFEAKATGANLPMVRFQDSSDYDSDEAFQAACDESDRRIASLPPGSVKVIDLTGTRPGRRLGPGQPWQ